MANRAKHYRVAEKQIEEDVKKSSGIYVSEEAAQKYLIIAVVVVLVSFIKGLLFGYLFSNK